MSIKYGGTDRTNLTYSTHDIKIILHPHFINDGFHNITFNYCILKLNDPVHITTKVKIIPIAKTRPSPGMRANVTSWGIGNNGSISKNLQWGSFKILSNGECQKFNREKITDDEICALGQNVSTAYVGVLN